MNNIEQEVFDYLKYAGGGVTRDEIAVKFDLDDGFASDVLRSLRYRGLVKFQFDSGRFHRVVSTDSDRSGGDVQ